MDDLAWSVQSPDGSCQFASVSSSDDVAGEPLDDRRARANSHLSARSRLDGRCCRKLEPHARRQPIWPQVADGRPVSHLILAGCDASRRTEPCSDRQIRGAKGDSSAAVSLNPLTTSPTCHDVCQKT